MSFESTPGTNWRLLIRNGAIVVGLLWLVLRLGTGERERQGFAGLIPDLGSDHDPADVEEPEASAPSGDPKLALELAQAFYSLLIDNQWRCVQLKGTCRRYGSAAADSGESGGRRSRGIYGEEAFDYGPSTDKYFYSGEEKPVEKDALDECLDERESAIEASWEAITTLRRLERNFFAASGENGGVLADALNAHEAVCYLAADDAYGEAAQDDFEERRREYELARDELRRLFDGALKPYQGQSTLLKYGLESDRAPAMSEHEYRKELAEYQDWQDQQEMRRQEELRREMARRKWQQERLEEREPRKLPKLKVRKPAESGSGR